MRLRDEFEALQQAIGYRFRDRGLLEHAMTHTSRANEDVSGGVRDNESLEFLGDAVLGFLIADLLFNEFPDHDEGQKSKIKAALVSTASLARLAERLSLGDHLLLGRGEEKTGGRRKQALLADGYEALIAAIYLDGGIEHARAFVAREFASLLAEARQPARPGRTTSRRCRSWCSRRKSRCPSTGSSARSAPIIASCFRSKSSLSGEPVAEATGFEQEGGRAGSGEAGARASAIDDLIRKSSLVDFDNAPGFPIFFRRVRRRRPPCASAGSLSAAAGAAARSDGLRARDRLRSAPRRGSAAAPRRAAADRCSCSASAATSRDPRPRATTGSPSSSPACAAGGERSR